MLLIHGFASTSRINWGETGWVRFLTDAGRQVITFDHRGHGESEKFYDTTKYSAMLMAEDAKNGCSIILASNRQMLLVTPWVLGFQPSC